MSFRSKMVAMLVQLGLLMISVIQLTSSQSTYDIIPQDSDVSSCGSNAQMLRQLVTANSELHAAVTQLTTTNSQLQSTVSQLQRDVAELKTEGRQTNATCKLCYFSSQIISILISILIPFVDHDYSSNCFWYF